VRVSCGVTCQEGRNASAVAQSPPLQQIRIHDPPFPRPRLRPHALEADDGKLLVDRVRGSPVLTEIGQGQVSVSPIPLGHPPLCVAAVCDRSSLVPLPNDKGSAVIRVGWTEIGDVGFDVDRASAQREAIKADIGPAAEKVLQSHFDREKRNDATHIVISEIPALDLRQIRRIC
jgi:hypothetical protein